MSMPSSATAAKTAEVFIREAPVHLRGKLGGLERMVPVICHGTQQPRCMITVQWTEHASEQASLPRAGLAVQLYTIANGVLYVAKGEVLDVGDGKLPRIRCTAGETCIAVPLRRHTRYHVQGQARLGEPGQPEAFRQNQPHPMDISQGGFGVEVPAGGWDIGKDTGFHLKIWVDHAGKAEEAYPVLELTGRVEIRNQRPGSTPGSSRLGLMFTVLPELQASALQLWLAAHVSFLREV